MSILNIILNRAVSTPFGQVILGSFLALNKLLCFKLLWMAGNDQRARQGGLKGRKWDHQIDRRRTLKMKQIIAQNGWPGEKLVGPMGAQAAWLLVQHADHDREFQNQCHDLLEQAVKSGEAQAHKVLSSPAPVGQEEVPEELPGVIQRGSERNQHVDWFASSIITNILSIVHTTDRKIAKVVFKKQLGQHNTDVTYWRAQTCEARLAALEDIRLEYHRWKADVQPGLQRVYRIVKL